MECPIPWRETGGAPSGKHGSRWRDGELLHAEKRLATRSRLVHVRPHRHVGPEHRGAAAPAASPRFSPWTFPAWNPRWGGASWVGLRDVALSLPPAVLESLSASTLAPSPS